MYQSLNIKYFVISFSTIYHDNILVISRVYCREASKFKRHSSYSSCRHGCHQRYLDQPYNSDNVVTEPYRPN